MIFTGPASSKKYFERLHDFIGATLGPVAQRRYKVILGDPGAVAAEVTSGLKRVRDRRAAEDNAYFFNWALDIGLEFQKPFEATHESMRALELHRDQPAHSLAFNLRRAFSGIVAGNVREAGIARVEKYGPFELRGDPQDHRRARQPAAGLRDGAPNALVGAERLRALLPNRRLRSRSRDASLSSKAARVERPPL